MRLQIEKAAAVLIGKALWTCRRAADMATFQFGARIRTKDFFGKPSEVGEYALHIQCAWRIGRGEEVLVGRRDVYYPADYQENEDIPADFDWDKHPNRFERLVRSLFEGDARSFTVQKAEAGLGGSLHLSLSDGYYLDVLPDDSRGGEHWRLFVPGKDEPHFVITGHGIEGSGPDSG